MSTKKNLFRINIFYFTLLTLILFFLLKILDIFLGYIDISNNINRYILPPNKKIKYETHEFNIIASTNKFGFRGNELFIKEGQIIVVGDSQIYGWGLNNNETWPFFLQSIIEQNNQNLKVYNLGVPGTNTNDHISVAKEYIKIIKPKIAIIGIGLNDDFQQVLEEEQQLNKISISENTKILKNNNLKKIIKYIYPNIYGLIKNIKDYDLNQILHGHLLATKDWKNISKEKFKKEYPIEIIELMEKGFINPGIFQYANNYPNRNLLFYKNIAYESSFEHKIYRKIIQNFKELKELSEQNGTRLFLLSIPSGFYVKSMNFEILQKYGFLISDEDAETFLPEEILEKMSKEINVNFIKTLKSYREFGKDPFFPYDGHLNIEGSKLMSKIVYNYLNENFF
jgi:hypothetical protein